MLNSMLQDEFQTESLAASHTVRKRKVGAGTTFAVANKKMPSVSEEAVESFDRWYDSSMKDTNRGQKTEQLVTEGLLAINRCGLQGKFSAVSTVQIPKLLWPLLIYEICSTTVEKKNNRG